MEEQWMVDRARLRDLMHQEPHLTQQDMATRLKRSVGWVQKWCKRLREKPVDDPTAVQRRAPPRPKRSPQVIERVLALREELPATLHRVPGPRALLYYLAQDETLRPEDLPRSTRTIWQILEEAGRIDRPAKRETCPLEPAEPLQVWQFDLKDATTARCEVTDKQQHQVEVFNVVDTGTSILLDSLPRADFNAETAILALTHVFLANGLPQQVTFDRDTRFIGSWTSGGFPSALMRYLLCLDVQFQLTPPRRPDKNAYVERFHRTLEYECLQVHRPATLEAVVTVTEAFKWHYNHERPNQARSCGNQPPYAAFPSLPRLRPLPDVVDPDHWLAVVDGKLFKRRVKHNGTVEVDKRSYYVKQALRGRDVLLCVDAGHQQFIVLLESKPFKHIAIKGLHHTPLDFQDYLRLGSLPPECWQARKY